MVSPQAVSEMLDRLRAVREGKSDGTELRLNAATIAILRDLQEVDYNAIGNLYKSLTEQSMFRKQSNICIHFAVLLADRMNVEMICDALSELHLAANHAPDIALDGACLFYRRGQKAFAIDDFAKAKNFFRRSVEIAPHFREGWYALAGTYELLGMSEEATDAFTRAAAL